MKSEIVKTSFSTGEISSDLYSQGLTDFYKNAAKVLNNVDVYRTGGVSRRNGSFMVKKLFSKDEFNNQADKKIVLKSGILAGIDYLFIFTHLRLEIYKDEQLQISIETLWDNDIIQKLNTTFNDHCMYVSSGKFQVQIVKIENSHWTIKPIQPVGLENNIFSNEKGYPISIAFAYGRLILAGTKTYQNRVWFSKINKLDYFALCDGLADDAMDIKLMSGDEEKICKIQYGRDLTIFTTNSEWIIEGTPLSPEKIVAKRISKVGSSNEIFVPLIDVDGEIMFAPKDNRGLHSIITTDTSSSPITKNVIVFAKHLVRDIVDLAYSPKHTKITCLKNDGTICVCTYSKNFDIAAWSSYTTDGKYLSATVCNDKTYCIVKRSSGAFLEVFSKDTLLDCTVCKKSNEGLKELLFTDTALEGFKGRKICILADGIVRSDTLFDKDITLTPNAQVVLVGYKYKHVISSLPVEPDGTGSKVRLSKLTFRLDKTTSLKVDVGKGLIDLSFKSFGTNVLNTPIPKFSGDKSITALGWQVMRDQSLWKVEGTAPLSMTILSVKADISINN